MIWSSVLPWLLSYEAASLLKNAYCQPCLASIREGNVTVINQEGERGWKLGCAVLIAGVGTRSVGRAVTCLPQ